METKTTENSRIYALNFLESWTLAKRAKNAEKNFKMGAKTAENPGICASSLFLNPWKTGEIAEKYTKMGTNTAEMPAFVFLIYLKS